MPVLPLLYLFNGFYLHHPSYVINPLEYRLSSFFFWENLKNLDEHFAQISYFFETNSLVLIGVLLMPIPYLAITGKRTELWVLMCLILLILFSFCSGKTLEGSSWIYMAYSRLYLGVPFFLSVFLPFVFRDKDPGRFKILFCIPLFFGIWKMSCMKQRLSETFESKNWTGVHLQTLASSLEAIKVYGEFCRKNDVSLMVVSHGFWHSNVLAYGGPAADEEFPETIETKADKRYWIREKYLHTTPQKFVIISSTYDIADQLKHHRTFQIKKLDDYGVALVENNTLPLETFIGVMREKEYDY
jgi:hypothetical protein